MVTKDTNVTENESSLTHTQETTQTYPTRTKTSKMVQNGNELSANTKLLFAALILFALIHPQIKGFSAAPSSSIWSLWWQAKVQPSYNVPDEALMCLEQATELDPGYVKARINQTSPGARGKDRASPTMAFARAIELGK